MTDLVQTLADFQGRGRVVAPAGFGKTHAVVAAVARCHRRQLLLTHTYAGVNAIRRKLRDNRVPSPQFYVTTIAGFALRLCRAYPLCSKYDGRQPATSLQWGALYDSCASILAQSFAARVMRASFGGVFVDEYQDCSIEQHGLVVRVADVLPCRVFGDPLQAIFDFGGQAMVDWEAHVVPTFPPIGSLETPHRWINANAKALGAWLTDVRARLEAGLPVDLSARLPPEVHYIPTPSSSLAAQKRVQYCRAHESGATQTVVALFGGNVKDSNRCHAHSRSLSGLYSSIEEIAGKRVFAFLRKLTRASTPKSKLKAAIGFAASCFTGVRLELAASTRAGNVARITKSTKNPRLTAAANAILHDPGSANVLEFMLEMRRVAGAPFCGDLFNRSIAVLRKHSLNPSEPLDEVARRYHAEFRHGGRPVGHRRIVATPLLVKGLEYDHAIVLDASVLPRNQLYVALTRGARSLAILSDTPLLNPSE